MFMMTGVVPYLETVLVQLTDLFPCDIVRLAVEEIETLSDEKCRPKTVTLQQGSNIDLI